MGTTLQSIVDACSSSLINATVIQLVSDKPDCGAVEIARRNSIKVLLLDCVTKEEFSHSLTNSEIGANCDVIVLAGFNRILPQEFVLRFEGKMINTHPALLPCFGGQGMYGMKVHRAVLESGTRISGASVHFVTNEVDCGPIIAQGTVEVLDSDTPESLAERVKVREKEVLIEAIRNLLERKFRIDGKRVYFLA